MASRCTHSGQLSERPRPGGRTSSRHVGPSIRRSTVAQAVASVQNCQRPDRGVRTAGLPSSRSQATILPPYTLSSMTQPASPDVPNGVARPGPPPLTFNRGGVSYSIRPAVMRLYEVRLPDSIVMNQMGLPRPFGSDGPSRATGLERQRRRAWSNVASLGGCMLDLLHL